MTSPDKVGIDPDSEDAFGGMPYRMALAGGRVGPPFVPRRHEVQRLLAMPDIRLEVGGQR